MSRKYDEAMEHIKVTPEMRRRILDHIQAVDMGEEKSGKVIRFPHIKQFLSLAACLALILVGALTLPTLFSGPDDPNVLSPGDAIVEVAAIDELADAVGFPVADLNGLPFRVEEITYTAYWQDLAEITYRGEGQSAIYRKGAGSDDVSGDYNDYASEGEIAIGEITVSLKGDENGYTLATWTDNGFSYSLALSEGLGEAEWRLILTQ